MSRCEIIYPFINLIKICNICDFIRILFTMGELKKIAVVGANGRMGSLICERLEPEYEIIKITEENSLEDFDKINLVIDFSCASQSVISANYCASKKIPLIIGATGQSASEYAEIVKSSQKIPIMLASNFSVGIFVVKQFIKSLSTFLSDEVLDITIIEKHHREKKDAPSGTAIALKHEIERCIGAKVNVLSVRGGKEIGVHQIDIYFGDEYLSISHSSFSRNSFVCGVELAVKKMLKQKKTGILDFEV